MDLPKSFYKKRLTARPVHGKRLLDNLDLKPTTKAEGKGVEEPGAAPAVIIAARRVIVGR